MHHYLLVPETNNLVLLVFWWNKRQSDHVDVVNEGLVGMDPSHTC